MDQKIRIREAALADVSSLAQLRAAQWGTHDYWRNRISSYMEGTVDPQKALASRIIYVAEEGDDIVGFIAGHLTRRYDCDGELEWIDVTESRRSTAIATALLQHLAQWFVEHDAKRICVDVTPENTVARKFYRKHGAMDLNPHWLVWPDIATALRKAL